MPVGEDGGGGQGCVDALQAVWQAGHTAAVVAAAVKMG